MKKYFFAIFLALLPLGVLGQNVALYEWNTPQTTSYTLLEGEGVTTLSQSTLVKGSDFKTTFFNADGKLLYTGGVQEMEGIDIGFDFFFEGVACDKFVAAGTGFILLSPKTDAKVKVSGNAAVMTHGWPLSIGIGVDPLVIGADQTAIRYTTEGTAAENNRVLIVEFAALAHEENQSTTPFNFQIRLYETSNKIEFLFDAYTVPDIMTNWGVGIEGMDGVRHRVQPNPLNHPVVAPMWQNAAPLLKGNFVAAAKSTFPKGLSFGFSVPQLPDCTAPTKTVKDMAFTSTDKQVGVEIDFNEEGEADAYLLLTSKVPFTGEPENGSEYAVGDRLAGGEVIARGDFVDVVRYTLREPDANTKYYYRMYLYNYKCENGPVYGDPYTDSAMTETLPPADLRITALTDTSIVLSATANEWNDTVLVAFTRHNGQFGKPEGELNIGDTLWTDELYSKFGGTLIYKGPASNKIVYKDSIPANAPYFFVAYSRTKEGRYSPSFIQADTLSPVVLPFYEDFSGMKTNRPPYGWRGTTVYGVYSSSNYQYTLATVSLDKEDTAYTANLVFPAVDFPVNRDLRLIFDYAMYWQDLSWNFRGMTRTDWTGQDSIVFEVSADGGAIYRPAYVITARNADEFGYAGGMDWHQKSIGIKGFYGIEKALLRIRYVSHFKEGKKRNHIGFRTFRLAAMDECDYPASVRVIDSTIKGDKATVNWVGGEHNETRWNLSYAMKDMDGKWGAWTHSEEVSGSAYTIESLESNRKYKVRMQSVCGTGSVSRWVETEAFNSGWTPAFVEDFNRVEGIFHSGMQTGWALPFGWISRKHNGSTEPDSVVFSKMNPITQPFYNWKQDRDSVLIPGKTNIAVTIPTSALSGGTTVLRLPEVSVRAEEWPKFVFDFAYGNTDGSGSFVKIDTTGVKCYDKLYAWISTDGGNVFVIDSAVRTWNFSELALRGDSAHVEIPLDGYDGEVVIALGVYTIQGNPHILWLDNMGVVYECPSAKQLALQAESLTETSASLTWWADPTHDSWSVIRRSNGEAHKQTVQGTTVTWNDLASATTYTVLVGQDCADTSTWSRISFKTGGSPCDPVSGLTVTEITNNSARLNWTGSAGSYRIRIRPVSETVSEWTVYEDIKTTSYVLGNLLPATAYEGGVQSVCGAATGDTAGYVDFADFTTQEITCFTPDSMWIMETDHWSALIAWRGEAGTYQAEFRQSGTVTALGRLTVTGKSVRIEDLTAETMYQVRLRSICAAGDTSAWSGYTEFSTTQAPACPEPFGLRAEAVTPTTARLAWSSPEEGAGFALRFSVASPLSWNNRENITDTVYELTGLEPETVYLWSVMSVCRGGNQSDWVQRVRFETTPLSNESLSQEAFSVASAKGQLHILNPGAQYIERIRLYTIDGRLAGDYTVRSNENVILVTRLSSCITVVDVESDGKHAYFKIFLP